MTITKEEIMQILQGAEACLRSVSWAELQPNAETIIRDARPDWWAWILRRHPDLVELCPEKSWKEFDGYDWEYLLELRPRFAEQCTLYEGWTKMTAESWICLLEIHPQFIENLERKSTLSKFDGEDWVNIIMHKPQFAAYADWEKLDNCDWIYLLTGNPEFADKCDWTRFDKLQVYRILHEQPQLHKYAEEKV